MENNTQKYTPATYATADDVFIRPARAAQPAAVPVAPAVPAAAAGSPAYAGLSQEEIVKQKRKQKRRTHRDFFWAGFMMIIFTLMMDFGGTYLYQLGMYLAVPDVVADVYEEGGLAAVSEFYYDVYSAPESEYYALSGITDNISYCAMVVLYMIPFIIFLLCRRLKMGKVLFTKGKGFSGQFLLAALVIGIGALNIWAEVYYYAAEALADSPFIDLSYIFELFEEQSNAAFSSLWGTVFYFLATCIFAPIGEEFVCRGVLLAHLRRYGDWWAILMTAMLFGLMHMNFYQSPYAFLMGIVLAFVTVKTESLRCAVLIHMINNTISTVNEMATAFLPTLGEYISQGISVVYMAAIPASIILVIILALKRQFILEQPTPPTLESRTPAKTFRFIITLPNLLFIFFCLLNCILLIIPNFA